MNKILKPELQEKVLSMPEYKYGINKVKCILVNGKSFSNVLIAWGEEILKVDGRDEIPFDADEIADIFNDL